MKKQAAVTNIKSKRKDSNASIMDGLYNVMTNMNVRNKDKRTGATWEPNFRDVVTFQAMYQSNDLAQSFIDTLPEDMTREGFEINKGKDAFALKIDAEFKRLGLEHKINEAFTWARLYGGALLYFKINDAQTQDQELDKTRIANIEFVHVLTRRDLGITEIETSVFSPNYLQPRFYTFNGMNIHPSRVIRFDGKKLDADLLKQNGYWHDSLLSAFYEPLTNFELAIASASMIMQDFSIPVIILKGLVEMLEAGKQDLIYERLSLLTKSASMVNAVLLQEGEEFEKKGAPTAGMKDILTLLKDRLGSASKMPHTIFWGEGADGGLGTEGQSEKRDWYDYVKRQQEQQYRPVLERAIELIALQKNSGIAKVPEYELTFNSLWQESETEVVNRRKVQAETDSIYIQNGVVDPESVAKSRFGGLEYSHETEVDWALRAEFDQPEEPVDGDVDQADKGKETESYVGGADKVIAEPDLVLNGAQVSSLIEVVEQVALGQIPRDTGLQIIMTAFALDPEQAQKIMGSVGLGFKPSSETTKE